MVIKIFMYLLGELGGKSIFSSSRMVYGKVETSLVTVQNETNPLSIYGIHKLTSEKYLLMYFEDFGIPCSILRLTNPHGPRQQVKHGKYSLVGWFIRQAMEEKVIKYMAMVYSSEIISLSTI